MDEEVKEQQPVEQKAPQKPLSKKEKKKLAKQEKKAKKKEQKATDREFEKTHPLRKRKIAAWIVELVGLVIALVPAVVIIGTIFIALCAYIFGAFVFLLLVFGLLIFGLGYLIYMNSVEHPSMDGYMNIGGSIINWANGLMNFLDKIDGWFVTIFAGVSLVIEIVGYVLLMTSLPACSKKHKVSYIVLMSLILTLSIAMLIFGITKLIPSGTPTLPPPTE